MSSEKAPTTQELVLSNVLVLVLAQAIVTPLSVLTNMVMGRYLGPREFGHLYLATTTSSCAFLFVDWGTGATVPGHIAKDRSRVGELVGTTILWRVVASAVIGGVVVLGSWVFGSPEDLRFALGLVLLVAAVSTIASLCQDTARGFERTDVTAYASVGGQLLICVLVIPTLVLGGHLRAALLAQLAACTVVLAVLWRFIRPTVGVLSFRADTLRALLREGSAFLVFGIAMVLQPYIDATFLSAFAPAEAVGWFAAAKRLVGVLVYPGAAMISGLYPTLCRLHAHDAEGFRSTVQGGLRSAMLIVVPATLGCVLYPDVGIRIFGREAFGPAQTDLRFLGPFVFLVYFSMVLGIALLAAGRSRAWAAVQFVCVIVSLVGDPLLVPWFQKHSGNGGLGICVSNVASEALMVAGGIWLTVPGVFDRALWRKLALVLPAAAAMTAVARVLWRIPPLVAAPISVAAYVVCLWLTGGITRDDVQKIGATLGRKLRRR